MAQAAGPMAARQALVAAIDALRAAGDATGAAALIEISVAHGYWRRADQRPLHFLPDLPARPVHDTRGSYIARYFEQHASRIIAETRAVMGGQATGLSPVEESLVGAGAWDVAMFYEAGFRNRRICELFPVTAEIVEKAPAEVRMAGVVMFSWLHPGTHILPHCGFSNARLRLHLGLGPDTGARLRVADHTLAWEEGKCILFDDSFEHEVQHDGRVPRLVMLIDLFHPALQESSREEFVALFGSNAQQRAKRLLQSLGARRLALDPGRGFAVDFEPEQDRRIRRQMRDAGIDGMELTASGSVALHSGDRS